MSEIFFFPYKILLCRTINNDRGQYRLLHKIMTMQ